MCLILGIDGGGTRTRASIVDGEKVLAHGEDGSIKRLRVGAEAAEAQSPRVCSRRSSPRPESKASAPPRCGVASANMPGITEWITAVFNDFGVERSEVVGDEVIALDAAFHGGPGILQIAGTGSNTIGRAPDGSRETAGGWSSHLGDEGSGYWIGLHSVRRALRAYDREPAHAAFSRRSAKSGARPTSKNWSTSATARPVLTLPPSRPPSMSSPKQATPSPWESLTRPPPTSSNSSCWCAKSSSANTKSKAKSPSPGPAASSKK